MVKPPRPDATSVASEDEPGSEPSPFEPPPELSDPQHREPLREDAMPLPSEDFDLVRPGRSLGFKLAVGLAAAAVIAGGLLAYRYQHRKNLVAAGLVQASRLFRADTAASYREAASLLEPLAQIDPVQAGAARAFALGMLSADYGDADAAADADALLLAPTRADRVPSYARLATAALALGRSEVGTATAALSKVASEPWGEVLLARTAIVAGNPQAAEDPAAAAAAADPRLAAGLALHGDMLRRFRHDAAGARAAYEAALEASPLHPRAAFGLGKLAIAGDVPADEAAPVLQRVLGDAAGTPAPERARAALLLAALSLRAGDRGAASADLDAAALDAPSRAWADRAAAFAAESGRELHVYRALEGAPASLRSPNDDDPGMAPPPPLPPVERPAAKAAKVTSRHHVAKSAKAKAAAKRKASAKAVKPGAKKAVKRSPAKKANAKKRTTRHPRAAHRPRRHVARRRGPSHRA